MLIAGIKVLFIGKGWKVPYETMVCDHVAELFSVISKFVPDVIVSSTFMPGALKTADFELRKRWLHIDPESSRESVVAAIGGCYCSNIWGEHPYEAQQPLMSVYTGSYNSGDFLRDTYQSLYEQTYQNWEWVVVDDGSTDGTWENLLAIADSDHRVHPLRIRHSGKIGKVKDTATRLANGKYLVELDHDDMLVDIALDEVKNAFEANPDVGMVYTNCACFFPDGSPHSYTDEFWADRYRPVEYRGKTYLECRNPDIYGRFGPHYTQQFGWFLTVGPNHIRSYRAQTLRELGGYNPKLPVADDWDVYARFFLHSKCLHIDKMLYLYRFHDNWKNTTFVRNKMIQDHLALGRSNYEQEFIRFNESQESTSEKELSVVVLDWNTPELTTKCLESVKEHYPDVEVILVQNGEPFTCESADKVIPLEMNIGYAAGCNRGAMAAIGKYLCFLNSDTVVEAGLFEPLLAQVQRPDVGVSGPFSDNARPPQGYYRKDDLPQLPNGVQAVDSIVGVCLMIRRDLFSDLGGFDPQFCNFEDNDLCRRVRMRGLYCTIAGGSWIHHEEHASFTKNNVDVEQKIRDSQKLYEKKWPTIKVIAITYNERETLPAFLRQFRGIASSCAILDSGSTDGTVEWAKENGVEVAHREFDNFADQRNAAVGIFGHDADWIVMLDPDENLDKNTLENFWELVRSKEFEIYLAPLSAVNPDGSETEWVPKVFLYKNLEKNHWIFPVHEKLIGSEKQAIIYNGKITHVVAAHTPERRQDMAKFYSELMKEDREEVDDYPLLDYDHRDDPRIKKMFLGPLISVILPTYNRPELLQKAFVSALTQDYLAKEIIVIGDACPTLVDSGISGWNLEKNHGAGGAVPRNYGIMLAAGRWISYLDDDNLLKYNHLSSIFCAVAKEGAAFGLSSMEVEGKGLICERPEFGSVDTSCLLHRKSLIERFGWWRNREEAGYAHDWEFVRPWVEAGVRCAVTKQTTLIYNAETSGQREFLAELIGASEGKL